MDARSRVPIAKYVISAKDRGAPDSAYALLTEVPGSATVFEHRGLKASGLFSYRVAAVDQNGVKSAAAEVTNAP